MIEGLQIENAQKSGKVFYYPAVLTVKGVSQYRDDEISFVNFWLLVIEVRTTQLRVLQRTKRSRHKPRRREVARR